MLKCRVGWVRWVERATLWLLSNAIDGRLSCDFSLFGARRGSFESFQARAQFLETSYTTLTLSAPPPVLMSRCKSGILGKRHCQVDDGPWKMHTRNGIQSEARLACVEHGDASIELDGL